MMIYLDNNATTRVDATVIEAMRPYWSECYYNASSIAGSALGAESARCNAANAISTLLSCEPEELRFTSGATESNNWVVAHTACGPVGRIVTTAIEHSSVWEPLSRLRSRGFEVVEVPVDKHGVIDERAFENSLNEAVRLVTVMSANNESGAIQPLEMLCALVRSKCPAALIHTDATQSVGRSIIDLEGPWCEIDLLSFSGHKFGGPKGIGGLFVRTGIELTPFILGGSQEGGYRGGTTNSPALAGLHAAVDLLAHMPDSQASLRDYFEAQLLEKHPHTVIHSRHADRLSNTSCFSMPGAHGRDLVQRLLHRGIIVGTGSACSSGSLAPSRVLRAMGVSYDVAWGALRVSLSRQTTKDELDQCALALGELWQ
jgi:cysteine desulfurase